MCLGRQDCSTRGHDLHGRVLIPAVDGVLNGMPSGCGHVMFRDICRLAWVAQHADIHRQDTPALRPDRIGDIRELILFGVIGPHQQNCLVAHGTLLKFDPCRLEIEEFVKRMQ